MNNKKLIFDGYSEFKTGCPFRAADLYHVEVDLDRAGNISFVLTPIYNGEEPRGWDELDKEYSIVQGQAQYNAERQQEDNMLIRKVVGM